MVTEVLTVEWRLPEQVPVTKSMTQVDFCRELRQKLLTQIGQNWQYVVDGKTFTVGQEYGA